MDSSVGGAENPVLVRRGPSCLSIEHVDGRYCPKLVRIVGWSTQTVVTSTGQDNDQRADKQGDENRCCDGAGTLLPCLSLREPGRSAMPIRLTGACLQR